MYKELYKEIIDSAKRENRMKNKEIYYEKHHIIPDFLFKNRSRKGPRGHLDGNPNDPTNLILLTFPEHLICHYYLYEIYKNTRYEYSAGSSLQFFFVKATGNHKRQTNLTEIDIQFLKEMSQLREFGIECISNARKGKMPVVDAITREKIGSVSINHPKIISGEWIHHSKGLPSFTKTENRKAQNGSNNSNYKEMTIERKERLWKCVNDSTNDDYLKIKLLQLAIKTEFKEFKKISMVWIYNNYSSIQQLIDEVNEKFNTNIKYHPYHRSKQQKNSASKHSSKHRWYNNGITNIKVTNVKEFIKENIDFIPGKIKAIQ